ncbi:hydrolase [Actinoplanes sp. NBRC 14428]|nr:hydrolase [Actinoplanes sp. NBRC 14428]
MTAVFVHGVPETGVVWRALREELEATGVGTVALGLPGFGSERPAGFGATKDDYAAWLAGALRDLVGPIDLVGHDWGAGLVARVATAFDVPLRSWAIDCASVLHEDYVWHPMAQVWRTPGQGEEWMAAFVAAGRGGTGERGEPAWLKNALLEVAGADAGELEAGIDDTMGGCILDLYRSATPNIHAGWAAELSRPAPAPGLVLRATGDTLDDPARSAEVAARLGARTAQVEGVSHFWMMEDPAAAAKTLREFWSSLP